MEKGYYTNTQLRYLPNLIVAIHNKNGKGLLQLDSKNFKLVLPKSQSTIKMEKGYYIKVMKTLYKRSTTGRNPQ